MGFHRGPKIVTDGLVLYVDAANPKSYVSGNTTTRSLVGSVTGSLVNGVGFSTGSNGSWVFDGSNDLITYQISQNTANNFTVDVAAKCNTMTDLGTNRQTIWSFNNGTNGYELLDLEVWGNVAYSFNGNGTQYTGGPVAIASSIDANSLHIYTLSCRSGVFYWYIDGVFKTQYTPTYTGTSVTFKLASRGSGTTGAGQQWNGNIYFAKVYNTGLTAAEVLQNYNATKSRFGL